MSRSTDQRPHREGAPAGYVAAVAPREQRLVLRGIEHRLLHWGPPSADPIVLLHGFLDCADTFQFLVDALPRDWSFLALDWRGFGGSAWNAAPYWFPDYLADFEALLQVFWPYAGTNPDAAGSAAATQAPRVIGHSMGGNVASLYAGIRPGRLRWLVSLEGFGLPRAAADEAPRRYGAWLDELQSAPRVSQYESTHQLAAILKRRNPSLPSAHAAFIAQSWTRPQAAGGVVLHADPRHRLTNPVLYRREEAEACWRRATLPLLFVTGADSDFQRRLGDDGTEAYFRGIFPQLESATILSAGHMMHHEQPAAVAATIHEWAARHT